MQCLLTSVSSASPPSSPQLSVHFLALQEHTRVNIPVSTGSRRADRFPLPPAGSFPCIPCLSSTHRFFENAFEAAGMGGGGLGTGVCERFRVGVPVRVVQAVSDGALAADRLPLRLPTETLSLDASTFSNPPHQLL